MSLEKYRRGLVRPLAERVVEQVRRGDEPDPADVEHYAISDHDFEKYFQLFNDLERTCGVGGDDYTVDEVEPDERLARVLVALKTYNRRDPSGKLDARLDDLLDRLWGLCWRAKQSELPVFFVL